MTAIGIVGTGAPRRHLLAGLLFGITPLDPSTFAAVSVVCRRRDLRGVDSGAARDNGRPDDRAALRIATTKRHTKDNKGGGHRSPTLR